MFKINVGDIFENVHNGIKTKVVKVTSAKVWFETDGISQSRPTPKEPLFSLVDQKILRRIQIGAKSAKPRTENADSRLLSIVRAENGRIDRSADMESQGV